MNAVITGATKGIGRAIAMQLAKEGYNLAICARNEKDLKSLSTELSAYQVKVLALPVDCSVKAELMAFTKRVLEFAPSIDVLVNNVGGYLPQSLLDEDDHCIEYQLRLNLLSAYYLTKPIGRLMRNQTYGHIFNVCSQASKHPVKEAGSYSVTKAAMLSLNDVLRMELADYNVKVTALLPGSTYTASWDGTDIAPQKFVQPADVALAMSAALKMSSGANLDEIVLRPIQF